MLQCESREARPHGPTIGRFASAFGPLPTAFDWVGLGGVYSRGLGGVAGGLRDINRDVLEGIMCR